jgi:hypothetical protein
MVIYSGSGQAAEPPAVGQVKSPILQVGSLRRRNVMKITLDTSILPIDDILSICPKKDWDFAVVTVTENEGGTDIHTQIKNLTLVYETGVYGESKFGKAIFGSETTQKDMDDILSIISGGAFPRNRENLTHGQISQFRDSMIFHAHIREKRDIFVTLDSRAFINNGRREKLQERFGTRIMTRDEFLTFCQESNN